MVFSNLYIYSGEHQLRNAYSSKKKKSLYEELFQSKLENQLHIDLLSDKHWINVYVWKKVQEIESFQLENQLTNTIINNNTNLNINKDLNWCRVFQEAIPVIEEQIDGRLFYLIEKYHSVHTTTSSMVKDGVNSDFLHSMKKILVIHLPSIEFMPIYTLCFKLIRLSLSFKFSSSQFIIEKCFSKRKTNRELDWDSFLSNDKQLKNDYHFYKLNQNNLGNQKIEFKTIEGMSIFDKKVSKSEFNRFITVKWLNSTFYPKFWYPNTSDTLSMDESFGIIFEDESYINEFIYERLFTTTDLSKNYLGVIPMKYNPLQIVDDNLQSYKSNNSIIDNLQNLRLYRISLCKLRILLAGHEIQFMNPNDVIRNLFHLLNGMFVGLGIDKRSFENKSNVYPLFLHHWNENIVFKGFGFISHVNILSMHVYLRTFTQLNLNQEINTLFLSKTILPIQNISNVLDCKYYEQPTTGIHEYHDKINNPETPYNSELIPKELHLIKTVDESNFRDEGSYGGPKATNPSQISTKKHKLQRITSWS